MKKYAKRAMAAALAVVMALALAACGGRQYDYTYFGKVNPNTDQTEFLIVGGQSALSHGYTGNEVLNALMEEAGVHITWDTMSQSLGEQVNIRINGGDYPDAFMAVGFSAYDLMRYGKDGTLLDLTPYLTPEIMPNLSRILEEHPDIKAAITMDDGGIYGLPSGELMGTAAVGAPEDYAIYSFPQFPMINKAWLDELGLDMPGTLDELHDVLVAFRDNDMAHTYYGEAAGSTIPMSTGFDEWCWGQNVFYSGFGFTNWPNDLCNDLVLGSDGTVSFQSVSDKYRDAVTYFHDWYAEGLMDVEMFSQDTNQLIAKCSSGRVGVTTWWEINEITGDYAGDYVYLPILTGPKGTQYEGKSGVTLRDGAPIASGQLSVTIACESPINLLKFFDLWYDGETVMQLHYGPIGVYFNEKNSDGLWVSLTDAEAQSRFGMSSGEVKSENEVWGPKLILSEYYHEVFELEDRAQERLSDIYNYWLPQVGDTTYYPVDVAFTRIELDDLDWYRSEFERAVSEQEGLWLRDGGPTDAEWETYKEYLTKTCKMDRLLEIYQDAYDRYTAAQ